MRYSKDNTEALEGCSNYLKSLSSLLEREGVRLSSEYTSECASLVVDFEAFADNIQQGGDKSKRVDILYILENQEIQLIECKLRVKDAANLNNYKEELINKRDNSRSLCSSSFIDNSAIEVPLFIIVKEQLEEEAKSVMAKLFPITGKNQKFQTMSVSTLLNKDFV